MLASVAKQAGLSLNWMQTSKDRFSGDLAQILKYIQQQKVWN